MSIVVSFNFKKHSRISGPVNDGEIRLKGRDPRTIILLHGLTGMPNEMRFLASHFNDLGYSVICPRLADHGQSLQVLKYTKWEAFYSSLREVFLEARKSGDKIFVSGLSMSALLVLLLAQEFGSDISGVVCLSPTLFFDGWNVPWYNCFLPLVCYTPLKYFVYFKDSSPYGIKNEKIRRLMNCFYTQANIHDMDGVTKYGYAFFPLSLLQQAGRLVKYVTPKLTKINSPILFIHAKEDDTASLKNSQFIYDRVSSKDKEMIVLTDSYHIITADQERDKVASSMEVFLKKL
jgi:carboxylesterase